MMDRDRIGYLGRYAWVEFKRAVRLPIKSDKSHMCARILRGLETGRIHPGCAFTAIVRLDGVGSQVLSRLTIQAAARHVGVEYVHTPFETIAHAEGDPTEWVSRCEAAFGLGAGLRRREAVDLPVIDHREFALRPDLWSRPHLIEFSHFYEFTDRHPSRLLDLTRGGRPLKRFIEPRLTVAAHVRRGDVSTSMTTERYVSAGRVLSTVIEVGSQLTAAGFAPEFDIYSNGEEAEFAAFAERGMRLHLGKGALETFNEMKRADVLIAAKSTFSYVAGLYSDGLVLYDRFGRSPPPGWIEIGRRGGFSRERFARALEGHLPGAAAARA